MPVHLRLCIYTIFIHNRFHYNCNHFYISKSESMNINIQWYCYGPRIYHFEFFRKKYFWKFLSKRIIATPRWPQVMLCGSFMRQLWVLKEAQIGIAYRPPAIIILKKGHILFDNKMFFLCHPKIGIHIETTRKARSKTREVKSATMINLSYFLSGL